MPWNCGGHVLRSGWMRGAVRRDEGAGWTGCIGDRAIRGRLSAQVHWPSDTTDIGFKFVIVAMGDWRRLDWLWGHVTSDLFSPDIWVNLSRPRWVSASDGVRQNGTSFVAVLRCFFSARTQLLVTTVNDELVTWAFLKQLWESWITFTRQKTRTDVVWCYDVFACVREIASLTAALWAQYPSQIRIRSSFLIPRLHGAIGCRSVVQWLYRVYAP